MNVEGAVRVWLLLISSDSPGGLNGERFFLAVLKGSRAQVLTLLVPGEGCFPALLTAQCPPEVAGPRGLAAAAFTRALTPRTRGHPHDLITLQRSAS